MRVFLRTHAGPLAVVVACAVLSIAASLVVDSYAKRDAQLAFSADAIRRAARFREVLFDQLHDLEALALLVSVTPELKADFFRDAARFHRERRRAPGAYLWVERVPGALRETFEARMRAAGNPGYRLRERGAGGALVDAAPRDEYFPSVIMEPRPVERAAQGFDLGSNVERRRAMEAARDGGDVAMTGRLTLMTEPARPDGMLVFFPVFHGGEIPETLDARQRRLRGFVTVVLRIADLVAGADPAGLPPAWGMELTATGVAAERELLFSTAGSRSFEPGALRHFEPISVPGHALSVAYTAPAPAMSGRAAGTLATGLVLTLILVPVLVLNRRKTALTAALQGAELRLRTAFEASQDAISLKGATLRYEYANAVFCRLTRRPLEEIVGLTDREVFGESVAAIGRTAEERCIRDGESGCYEIENRQGPIAVWLDVQKIPLKDERGKVTGVVSIERDITLRKRAELDKDKVAQEALRAANERYRLATATAGIWIFSIDMATDLMEPDLMGIQRLGYEPQEFPRTSTEWRDRIVPPAYHAELDIGIRRLLHGEAALVNVTLPAIRRDGALMWLRIIAGAERGADGRVLRLLGTSQEVTEHVLARRALDESEARWRFALEGAGDGIWDWNVQTGRVYFSRRWKSMLGHDEEEIGDTFEEWRSRLHVDDVDLALALVERHLSGRSEVYVSEHRLRCKDGRYKWILARGKILFRDEEGRPSRIIGTHSDIDARKAAECALDELAEGQRAVLDNLLAGVIVIDERGIIEKFSRQAGTILGYAEEEVVGRKISMLAPSPHRERHDGYLARYLETGVRAIVGATRELTALRKDGTEVPIELGVTEIVGEGGRRYTGMIRDLTAQRAAQAARVESEQRFRLLFENSPEPIIVQREGVVEMANQAAVAMYGAPDADALIGRHVIDFVDPAMREQALSRLRQLLDAPVIVPLAERRYRRLDGVEFVAEVCSASFRTSGGMCIVTAYRDVTERKCAEEALRRSERLLREVIDLVPHFIFCKDREGRYLMANRAYAEYFGFTTETILGKLPIDLGMTAVEAEHTRDADARARSRGEAWRVAEQRVTGPDGRTRIYSTVRMPFHFGAAHPDAVLAVSIDITDLMDASDRVGKSLALVVATLEATDNGFMVTDEGGKIVRWNRRMEDFFHLPRELLERGDRAAVLDATRDIFADFDGLLEATARQLADPGFAGTYLAAMKDGRFIERYTQPLVMGGVSVGRVWSYRDVTSRERERVDATSRRIELEGLVDERTAELEEANRDLLLFTSTISHDLRAPLRAVDGFVQIALEEAGGALPRDARRHLERVVTAVDTMSAMVEGLLALARHARAPIHRQSNDVAALAREVYDEAAPDAGRWVEVRAAPMPPAEADPVLLRVVLQNLIGNALKYSAGRDPAVIEVGATQVDGRTAWFVRDNGAGFDPQYAAKLFQPFGRLHSPREFEGTGIGLAAVHRILERHGGRIWADSRPGEGATFHFTLG